MQVYAASESDWSEAEVAGAVAFHWVAPARQMETRVARSMRGVAAFTCS
jgi:hypothetical protein